MDMAENRRNDTRRSRHRNADIVLRDAGELLQHKRNRNGKIDGITQPIEGIEVRVCDSDGYYGTEHTDSSGKFAFESELEGTYEITLKDVDGTEHGSFTEKKIGNVILQDDKDLGEITLENDAE